MGVLVGKQTGRGCAVKGAWLFAAVTLTMLSACASPWVNSAKSPQETKADERTCVAEAEETALASASRQRVEYGRKSPVQPGMSRGETPMEMVDRTRTENTYQRDFESCMRSKGYAQNQGS